MLSEGTGRPASLIFAGESGLHPRVGKRLKSILFTATDRDPGSASWPIPVLGRRVVSLAGRLDWGLVLAIALAGFAAGPFLARPALPRHTDAELHVYRTAELNRLVEEGIPYPRWAANLYLGYGYP
ncbi:MAG: hypothetical protein ACOC8C_00305, partial [Chloroflexota bacterium]